MKFKLAAKGTTTECREALNGAITKLQGPHTQEHAVVRNICHFVVEENLDPLYAPWAAKLDVLRAAGLPKEDWPAEPTSSFSIDLTIDVKELARKEK